MNHLLSVDDLGAEGIEELMRLTDAFVEVSERRIPKVPTLRGRTVVSLFYEESTRTRLSFETAAKRLSADTMNFTVGSSSVKKGESLRDTVLTIEAMGVDAIVVRHSSAGVPWQIASWVDAAVINAGDGWHEHPTQALLRKGAEQDPELARKKIIMAFSEINVSPDMLEGKLGHPLGQCSPAEIAELRKVYKSIADGNSTWAEYAGEQPGNGKTQEKGTLNMSDLKPAESGFTPEQIAEAKRKEEEARARVKANDEAAAKAEEAKTEKKGKKADVPDDVLTASKPMFK